MLGGDRRWHHSGGCSVEFASLPSTFLRALAFWELTLEKEAAQVRHAWAAAQSGAPGRWRGESPKLSLPLIF